MEGLLMTSFVHVEQPAAHPGVTRAEAVYERIRSLRHSFDGSRGLAALLLAAIVSSLLVVADKLVSNLNDGGLLAAWLVMWGVAFAGLAFFAGTARRLAARVTLGWRAYSRRRDAARADEHFMAYAQHDVRVMNEIHAAATRHEAVGAAAAKAGLPPARGIAGAKMPVLYEADAHGAGLGKFY
jgi:hypothetical protein